MKDHKALPKKSTSLVIGRNAVSELLDRPDAQSRVVKAYIQKHEQGADATGAAILSTIKRMRIPTVEMHRGELASLCDSQGHQGFVLEVHPRQTLDLHGLLELAQSFDTGMIVALDGVQDPQNLGSILRACECLGVKAVFWSHNRGVGLTSTVSKVSAGASEIVPIATVSNLRDAIEKLKKEGFWSVASVISDDAEKLSSFSYPDKTCLILGSEGDGVKALLAKEADFRVYIQQFGIVDSLNVSQAAAVFLAEFARQKL